jgi:hypothetical protein
MGLNKIMCMNGIANTQVGAIVGICAAVIGVFAIIVLVVIKLRDFQKNSADTEMRSSEIQSERVSV